MPCPVCLPLPERAEKLVARMEWRERILAVARLLEDTGSLEDWAWIAREEDNLDLFERFFERLTGSRPWSVQWQWARRLLRGESFAITAPTGTGKTTLLMLYALYAALNGKRVYYLLPTSSLARQVAERLTSFAARLGGDNPRVAYYHSLLPPRVKREQLARIESGEYDILVTTTAFLSRRWGVLEGRKFNLIIVDDVDAVLRESVNVERILLLLGASRDVINAASRLVRLEMRLRLNPALRKRYEEEIERLRSLVLEARRALGQLVIASATGRPRGFKRLVLQKLLGLSVGSITGYARNIAEYGIIANSFDEALGKLIDIVAKLGPGGLVYVAKPYGVETVRKIVALLGERGVRAAAAVAGKRVIEKFEHGEYDVLVGVASYYGVMVRGLDLPYRVAYAVFLEPPHNRLELEKALLNPRRILVLAKSLGLDYEEYARMLAKLTPDDILLLRAVLEGRIEAGERLARVAEEARRLAGEVLSRVRELESSIETPAGIVEPGSRAYLLTPDPYTYIQASGRVSRLIRGRMTRGLVVIVSWHPALLRVFESRLSRIVPGFQLKEYDEEEVLEELEKAWESRRSGRGAIPVDIETGLLVVESPTKARVIAGFWGRPARKSYGGLNVYETVVYNPKSGKTHVLLVTSVKGHVYDLTEEPIGEHGVIIEGDEVKPVYAPILRCRECGSQHAIVADECPDCGSRNVESKAELVEALRRLAPLVDTVYIGTDPDAEGEKIAWDLYVLLKPFARSIKRIEFHEVTRDAILEALANPREPDRRLVEAQMLRRLEDRWIGFELSKHLWSVYGARWLGAGRVQTPALGFLVERLKEWKKSRCYALLLKLPWGNVRLCFRDGREAREAYRIVASEGVVRVDVLEEREEVLTPPPPYTTETLLYDASRLLGYTSEKAMRLAQELFENGLITYHRTDSVRVSDAGIMVARVFFEKHGLGGLFVPRHWGEGGAHEAIRPTHPLDARELRDAIAMGEVRVVTGLRESHYRLYSIVFARFMASQAKPARVKIARIRIEVASGSAEESVITEIREQGFLRFYPYVYPVALGLKSGLVKVSGLKLYRTSTARLYTHGDLVLIMKKVGIGRPSTYAKIIEALKRHGYVVESKYRKYLIPTRSGVEVYEYLSQNFPSLVSVERTRLVEELMDRVSRGEADAAQVALDLLREVKSAVSHVEHGGSVDTGKALSA